MANRRGRPRSEAVRGAILTAAAELAAEGGPGAATIDAIARRAEVSRTTIYKWWPSAASIVTNMSRMRVVRSSSNSVIGRVWACRTGSPQRVTRRRAPPLNRSSQWGLSLGVCLRMADLLGSINIRA